MATNQELLKAYLGHADKTAQVYYEHPSHTDGLRRIYELALAEAKQSVARLVENAEDEHVDCEHTFTDGAKTALQEIESSGHQK